MLNHLQCNRRYLIASGLLMSLNLSSKAATPTKSSVMNAMKAPSLHAAYKGIFPIGAAITPGQVLMSSPEFIKHHFNIVVAENAMKPEELVDKRVEGKYNFERADELVNFAVSNGIQVRGHTLLWHNQYAPWFFNGKNGLEVTRADLITRIQTYIADVVGHFEGRVFAWDVVNEAYCFGETGVKTDDKGMRMSRLREIVGPEFIEIAFRAAAKADPNALLFYNDYETQNSDKVNAIVNMVKDFKARGIKIDGIGHQAHCAMVHPSVAQYEQAIVKIGALGVTQHITELDIALNNNIMENKITEATPKLLNAQGERYRAFFDLFVKHKKYVTAVLVWGIDDGGSWLTGWPTKRFEAPLLFDPLRQTKPAFWQVLEAAKG
jgi:endo-1,4-beta-xylanase